MTLKHQKLVILEIPYICTKQTYVLIKTPRVVELEHVELTKF